LEFKFKTLKQKVIIPAAPEQVYEAIIDGEKHSKFTGSKATSEPKVGGKFTAWDGYIFGKHIELEKGKKIVQEWSTNEWPKGYPPSIFELRFKKVQDGTEIEMIHSKVPEEQADDYDQGWKDYYWTPLKKYFKKRLIININ
jgi:activator of HSP90 ATPase